MNRKLTLKGALLIVLSMILPALFFLSTLMDSDLISGILLGLDWFCCFGWSGLLFIVGILILVIGIRTD